MNRLTGHIHMDFRSNVPLYLQLARQVEQLVSRSELRPGDQLPTVRELATELRINFNTVSRAYRLLDEAGLISTQRGRGTYIWEKPTEAVSQALRRRSLHDLTRRYLVDARGLGFSNLEIFEMFQELLENQDQEDQIQSE